MNCSRNCNKCRLLTPDVTTKSLHDWINKYSDGAEAHHAKLVQDAELRKLKAELKRVTMERDILKGAAVYFANESKKGTRL